MGRRMTRRGRRRERRARTMKSAPAIPGTSVSGTSVTVVQDAEEVFRAAILAGVLSAERSHRNWAGHYLYMFHDEDGTAWFKHRDTGSWVSMTARQRAAGHSCRGHSRRRHSCRRHAR